MQHSRFRTLLLGLLLLATRLFTPAAAGGVATFTANNSAIFQSGYFDTYSVQYPLKPGLRFASLNCQLNFTVHGTDCTLNCWAAFSPAVAISVDGGAFQALTPAVLKTWSTIQIFSNLPDADHTVALRQTGAYPQFEIDQAAPLTVQGSAPALMRPSLTDPNSWGTQQYLLATQTGPASFLTSEANTLTLQRNAYGYPALLAPAAYTDGSLVFRATCSALCAWMYQGGGKWQVRDGLHGRNLPAVTIPNTGQFGWVTLGTGLNPAEEHFIVLTNLQKGSGIYSLMLPGGGTINTSRAAPVRSIIAVYGHSIVTGAVLTDISQVYYQNFSQAHNYGIAMRGFGGSTFVQFPNNPDPKYNAQTGVARLPELVALQPAICILDYFTLDMSIGPTLSPPETPSMLQDALTSYLSSALAQCPNTQFYVLGILDRVGYSSQIPAWNAAVQGAVSTIADPRCHYVDQGGWINPYTQTTDGLHPNPTGNNLIGSKLGPIIFGK